VDFPQPRLPLPPPAVVELRGVTKRFGDRVAVEALDLAVERGACFGLLGPNGAGKTTALRMVYGVTRPTAGVVRVFGLDVARAPRAVRSRLGVTLQENVLLEALSPLENLRTFGRYHLLREPELSRRALELIELFELGSHARAPVKVLSGGMQRRLAIGLSLMNRPELLILDEPTTGLDPQVRLALWSRVRDLRAGGTTVLLTTHYMDEAEHLCDRVAIVDHGKIVALDTPEALIRSLGIEKRLVFALPQGQAAPTLAHLPQVSRVELAGDRLTVYGQGDRFVSSVVSALEDAGVPSRDMRTEQPNLEDVFLALTGRAMRE